jgi:F420H(2)-dependent quinone reductase
MPAGRARFVVMNRLVNPFVAGLLRSPLHSLLSGRLALITVTGRRSGTRHTFPVGYRAAGDVVTIAVVAPESKLWWRNVRGGAPVALRLRGVDRAGRAEAHGDERAGVTVEVRLDAG